MRFPDDVPVLTDGTVTLRPHSPRDIDEVLEQCTDPVSQRWTTVPVPYSRADAAGFVTEVVPAGWAEGHWAFAVEAADEHGVARFCGTVSLIDEGNRRAEIAYGAHPWARGRGVMQRALRLLLEWGFTDRRLRTVVWWANTGNWASRRTAWRLGFSCDGTVERWLAQRGDLLDGWIGVLHVDDAREPRHEWLAAPRLEGGLVTLRALAGSDVERVREACADELTQHWFAAMPRPYTADDARALLLRRGEQQADGTGVGWAVADPVHDVLLGHVWLIDHKPGRDAELGFWVHPDARGRGVATEACALVVRHALTPAEDGGLGLVRLAAAATEANAASRHVIEAAGFTLVGRDRRALRLRDGTLVDDVRYDLLAEEYAGTGSSAGAGSGD